MKFTFNPEQPQVACNCAALSVGQHLKDSNAGNDTWDAESRWVAAVDEYARAREHTNI